MTPKQFHDAYRPTANQVSAGTGIDPIALLSQWANETAWATSWAGAPFNLGNIEDSSGHVIAYPSLSAFAVACINTFHNGLYNAVLAARDAISQLNAIVASPWAAGHYGGTLLPYYRQLEDFELTPDQAQKLDFLFNDMIGGVEDNAKGVTATVHRLEAEIAAVKGELDAIKASLPSSPIKVSGTFTGTAT